ncbi:MAG: ATP-binding protein [Gammaproteobacteria bacterium]
MPETGPRSLRRLLLAHDLAFLVLLIITGGLAALWGSLWQQSSLESMRLRGMSHTGEQIRAMVYRQMHEVTAAALRDDAQVRELDSRHARAVQEAFNALRRDSGSRGEDYAVQNLQTAFSLLRANLRATLGDTYALNRLVRAKLLDPDFERRFVADFESAYAAFTGLMASQAAAQEQRVQRRLALAPWALSLPIALGIGLVLRSRRALTRDFVRPMRTVLARLRAISAGARDAGAPPGGVTEVRELAQGIERMAAELAASQRALVEHEREAALGGLIPVVAHNVRNPLAAIRANAQLLDGGESAAELAESRAAIIDTCDRLGRWVTALVSYLHPLTPRLTTFHAVEPLDAVAGLLAPRIAEQGLELRRAPWHTDAVLEADRDLLEQALYGLVNNAVEASPRGASLTLGVEADDRELRLTIVDEAGGLPFQPEPSELKPGPSTKRFGTGLGIPIAFKICKAHGFELSFDVTPGSGTRVVLRAPRARLE